MPCAKRAPHDWAVCLGAHKGERAARRPPARYMGVACPHAKRVRSGGVARFVSGAGVPVHAAAMRVVRMNTHARSCMRVVQKPHVPPLRSGGGRQMVVGSSPHYGGRPARAAAKGRRQALRQPSAPRPPAPPAPPPSPHAQRMPCPTGEACSMAHSLYEYWCAQIGGSAGSRGCLSPKSAAPLGRQEQGQARG